MGRAPQGEDFGFNRRKIAADERVVGVENGCLMWFERLDKNLLLLTHQFFSYFDTVCAVG